MNSVNNLFGEENKFVVEISFDIKKNISPK